MIALLCLFCMIGCEAEPLRPLRYLEGRNGEIIYQAIVPKHWEAIPINREAAKDDTMLAVHEFLTQGVHIAIHTFPRAGIAPEAQVARWLRQGPFDPFYEKVEPVSHGGFYGLRFQGRKGDEGVIAYSFVMAEEHARSLRKQGASDMLFDVTIKAVGKWSSLMELSNEIEQFAKSFELIDPLPNPYDSHSR